MVQDSIFETSGLPLALWYSWAGVIVWLLLVLGVIALLVTLLERTAKMIDGSVGARSTRDCRQTGAREGKVFACPSGMRHAARATGDGSGVEDAMCNLVLLLPLFGLAVFWSWPPAVAVPVYLAVLVVSAGVYYLALVAMRLPVRTGREALSGARGKVVSVASGELRVRVRSEVWRARASDKLSLGDPVEVQGIDGLTLKVKRIAEGAQSAGADHQRGSVGMPHGAPPVGGPG